MLRFFFCAAFLLFFSLSPVLAKCPPNDPFCSEPSTAVVKTTTKLASPTDACSMKSFQTCNKYLYLPDAKIEVRYMLLFAALLLAYLLPVIFYTTLLRSNQSPSAAASLCLACGGFFIAVPSVTLLLAKKVFLDGKATLVPFYKQTPNFLWIVGVLMVFVILALVSNQSKASE
jgi:hypothetical protein